MTTRGISAKEFAEMVGVSANTVSNWTTGRYTPGHRNLQRIASALGMTLDALHDDRVPSAAAGRTAARPRKDVIGDEAAQRIVQGLARLDIETQLEDLRRAAPDLMSLLSQARAHAVRAPRD